MLVATRSSENTACARPEWGPMPRDPVDLSRAVSSLRQQDPCKEGTAKSEEIEAFPRPEDREDRVISMVSARVLFPIALACALSFDAVLSTQMAAAADAPGPSSELWTLPPRLIQARDRARVIRDADRSTRAVVEVMAAVLAVPHGQGHPRRSFGPGAARFWSVSDLDAQLRRSLARRSPNAPVVREAARASADERPSRLSSRLSPPSNSLLRSKLYRPSVPPKKGGGQGDLGRDPLRLDYPR